MMKKIVWLMLVTFLFSMGLPAANTETEPEAEEEIMWLGDYCYRLLPDDTAEIACYFGEEQDLNIPSQLDGHSVTSIGDSAFFYCESLRSIVFPDSLKSIGNCAFNGVTIPSITLPDGLKSIGRLAFCDSPELRSITIPDSVEWMGGNPFAGCSALTEIKVSPNHPVLEAIDGVLSHKAEKKLICFPAGKGEVVYVIPEGIKAIGDDAFSGCDSLSSIILPESLVSIGETAFRDCKLIGSIMIPDSLTSIGESAFLRCESLSSITLPEGLTSIGDNAFYGCKGLRSVVIPDSVESIGANPFGKCSNLTRISVSPDHPLFAEDEGVLFDKAEKKLISFPAGNGKEAYVVPQGIKAIGDDAFFACSSLRSITLPEGLASIGEYAFAGCDMLRDIIVPESLNSIGERAFFDCTSLCSLVLPEGVTSIGEHMFYACFSLESITLPKSVTSIKEDAFHGCDSLKLTVERDSYAEKYAKENGLDYQYSDSLDCLNE